MRVASIPVETDLFRFSRNLLEFCNTSQALEQIKQQSSKTFNSTKEYKLY